MINIVKTNKHAVARLNTGTRELRIKFKDDKEKQLWLENISKAKKLCVQKSGKARLILKDTGAQV